MTQLRLSYNSISGHIPLGFYLSSSNLSYLALTENLISGHLPDMQSGHSLALQEFLLNGNMLTGTIPDTINQFSNLLVLFIGYNNMKGSIPDSLFQLTKLQRLAVNTNSFTGTFPAAISQLSDLRYTYWHENYFYSSIPESIGQLHYLLYITLFENYLTSSIPRSVGNMTRLRAIAADTNYLTGSLPTEMGDVSGLEQLNLYHNHLTGPIPTTFAKLRDLNLVLLQENHMSGEPAYSFNRSLQLNLESVDLSSNFFEGPIPVQIFGPALLSFSAFQTCFSGALPDTMCDSLKLQSLVLDGATSACSWKIWPAIEGSPEVTEHLPAGIPHCLWDLTNLTVLHLSSNGLTGTIPTRSSYGNLSDLDLSFNLLSGPVPQNLLGWPQLHNLNLKNNRFCGDITGAAGLHYAYHDGNPGATLSLSQNRFSGIIPLEIQAALNIDIVEGNMFSCTFKHLPPYNDPNGPTYVCGSNLLYVSLAALAGALGLVVLVCAAAFWVAYHCVVLHELENRRDTPYRVVLQHMSKVYSSLSRSGALLEKVRAEAAHRLRPVKALVVMLFHWKAQVDTLVRTEDAKNEKITRLGNILKEALFSNPDPEALGEVATLHEANLADLQTANIPHLVQFLKSLRLLRNISLLVFLAQILCTFPAYPILKYYRGTFLFQYGWYMSGAFLSGYAPPAVITFIWALSLAIVLYTIVRFIPSRKALSYRVALQNRAFELLTLWQKLENSGSHDTSDIKQLASAQVSVEAAESASYNMFYMFGALSRTTTINREDPNERDSIQLAAISNQPAGSSGTATAKQHTPSANTVISPFNTAATGAESWRGERSTLAGGADRSVSSRGNDSASSTSTQSAVKKKTLFGYVTSYFRESVGVSIAAVLLDVIVVLSIKGAFVYALNLQSTTFMLKVGIELCLSFIDLIWSVMFVPFIITRLPRMKSGGKMILKIALLYFNSIVAPCLAILVTERSCFNGIFIKQASVQETFSFSFCALYNPSDLSQCEGEASWFTSLDYTPPFLYNYDCYSNVITAYTPIFIFSYSILSISLPIASMYIPTLTKRKWFRGVLPAIFWLEQAPNSNKVKDAAAATEGAEGEEETEERDEEEEHFTLSTLQKVSNRLSMLSFKTLSPASSRTNLVSADHSDTGDSTRTTTALHISSPTKLKRRRRPKAKAFLFFPGFILASAIHHILVLLTFGLMLPMLGIAIVLVVWITVTTWELLLGRYLTLSPHCDPTRWQEPSPTPTPTRAPPSGSDAGSDSEPTDGVSSQSQPCTPVSHRTRNREPAAGTADPEDDCSGGLDRLCVEVCCCPRKCKLLIAYGSAFVFAFATLDMAADTNGPEEALWAPLLVLLLPVLLLACLKYCHVGTLDEQAYLDTVAQQSTTETMMLMRDPTVGEDSIGEEGEGEIHNVILTRS